MKRPVRGWCYNERLFGMTRSIIWTAVACISRIFNMIIYHWPKEGLVALGCMVVVPWWAKWRLWSTAFLSFLGITRHWSTKIMSQYTERHCLTSQYCQMLGGVRCCILGNLAWIVLISCWYSGSTLLFLFRNSIVIKSFTGGGGFPKKCN